MGKEIHFHALTIAIQIKAVAEEPTYIKFFNDEKCQKM